MTALGAAAVWLQPALLAGLALRVTAGAADAPWLALGALIAPLVALLAPDAASGPVNPVARAATAVALALVLGADLALAADAAVLLGVAPSLAVATAAAVALVVSLLPGARPAGAAMLAVIVPLLVLPLVAVGLTTGTAPWTAWSRGGLRTALTFAETSDWVGEGERVARPTRLTFGEGQRVTALSAGVYRVVERDAVPPVVREWRLSPGETLTLRPGDELAVEAGTRLRFEAGRRVPGAPVSGAAWADAPSRGPAMLPAALGALATLVGGAVGLVPAARRGAPAALAPLALLTATTTAVAWGVYAAAAAPDLALGGSLAAPVLRLPARALGARTGAPLAVLALAALAGLLLTAAVALRGRLAVAGRAPALWAAVVTAAALLAAAALDPWHALGLGLGLAAAACAPARLARGRAAALAGSAVGAAVFVALAGLPWTAPAAAGWLGPLVQHPALAALPLGWAAAWALREAPGRNAATSL
jgi:hypothetical protein